VNGRSNKLVEVKELKEAEALALLKTGDEEALEWFIDRYSAYVGLWSITS